ncbi:M14 family zinc carboxypeptidase [Chlamydiota bacterium]
MLYIHDSFEGASLGPYQIADNKIITTFKEEQMVLVDGRCHDYNVHFFFGIENRSETNREVEVYINTSLDKKDILPPLKPLLFFQTRLDSPFITVHYKGNFDQKNKKLYFSFLLLGGQCLYVSNTVNHSLEVLFSTFNELGAKGNARKIKIGTSVEGKELNAYCYESTQIQKPTILLTSGFHPKEPDRWATEAIMEFLTTNEGQRFLAFFTIYIVPIVNPDGLMLGTNACNSSGNNFFWNFITTDESTNPEAFYLWKCTSMIQPILYIDFHCYTYDIVGKYPGPYLKPIIFYEGKTVRSIAKKMEEKFTEDDNEFPFKGFLTFAPSTFASQLTKKYNTITISKYHLHLLEGEKLSKDRAVALVKKLLTILISYGITRPSLILKCPFGEVKRNPLFVLIRYLLVFFYRTLYPVFEKIMKGLRRLFFGRKDK